MGSPLRYPLARLSTFVLIVAAFGAVAQNAHGGRAYQLQVEGGYAMSQALGGLHHGGALGVRGYVGLTDFILLGGAARFDAATVNGTLAQGFVGISALFRLDVLKWVPFATLDVGPVVTGWSGAGPAVGADLEIAVGLGVDYLLRRGLAIGAALRYHVHATDPHRYPAMLTVLGHIAWRFE